MQQINKFLARTHADIGSERASSSSASRSSTESSPSQINVELFDKAVMGSGQTFSECLSGSLHMGRFWLSFPAQAQARCAVAVCAAAASFPVVGVESVSVRIIRT